MSREEKIEKLKKQLHEVETMKLNENSELIKLFIEFCKTKNIILSDNNISYIPTIGLIATYPNLVKLLNDNIRINKEQLVSFEFLNKEYKTNRIASGFLFAEITIC